MLQHIHIYLFPSFFNPIHRQEWHINRDNVLFYHYSNKQTLSLYHSPSLFPPSSCRLLFLSLSLSLLTLSVCLLTYQHTYCLLTYQHAIYLPANLLVYSPTYPPPLQRTSESKYKVLPGTTYDAFPHDVSAWEPRKTKGASLKYFFSRNYYFHIFPAVYHDFIFSRFIMLFMIFF